MQTEVKHTNKGEIYRLVNLPQSVLSRQLAKELFKQPIIIRAEKFTVRAKLEEAIAVDNLHCEMLLSQIEFMLSIVVGYNFKEDPYGLLKVVWDSATIRPATSEERHSFLNQLQTNMLEQAIGKSRIDK